MLVAPWIFSMAVVVVYYGCTDMGMEISSLLRAPLCSANRGRLQKHQSRNPSAKGPTLFLPVFLVLLWLDGWYIIVEVVLLWFSLFTVKSFQEKKQERKAAKTLSFILLVFLITWTPYNVLAVMKAILGAEHEVMQKTWFDKMLTYPVQSLGDNPLPKCMFFTHCKNGLSSPTPSILHLLFKSYTQFWASIISQHSRKLATYIWSSIPQSFFVGDWFEWHYGKHLKIFIEYVFLDNGHHTLLVQAMFMWHIWPFSAYYFCHEILGKTW